MAKLIVLSACVLLVASVAQAAALSVIQDEVTAAAEKATSLLESTLDLIDTSVVGAQEEAETIVFELQSAGTTFVFNVLESLNSTVNEAFEEISVLEAKANGVNVTECTALISALQLIATSIVVNVSSCVVEKVDEANAYAESIITAIEAAVNNLTSIKSGIDDCTADVSTILAANEALVCVNLVVLKAEWAAANVVPTLLSGISGITSEISTLKEDLTTCAATEAMLTLVENASLVYTDAKACVDEKLSSASS